MAYNQHRHWGYTDQIKLEEEGLTQVWDGVAPRGVTSTHVLRLRRRQRWVCRLQDMLGGNQGVVGAIVRGRWKPDLPKDDGSAPMLDFVTTLVEDGAKVLGGGTYSPVEGYATGEVYLHLLLSDGVRCTVIPSLVAELQCYAAFRPRSAAVLQSLKHRALDWVKRSQLGWVDAMQGFHGSMLLGFRSPPGEISVTPALVRALELNSPLG